MGSRMGGVVSERDFPAAELRALVLDGEVWPVDDCVVALDEANGPFIRAAVLALELPPRLIVEQHSTAWVWGAAPLPPTRHEVCADISARARPPLDSGLNVREVVILHDDIATLAGIAVTTPMRTAIDLARFSTQWGQDEIGIVKGLLVMGGFGILDCARVMNRRRNLPNKKMALERLAQCVS